MELQEAIKKGLELSKLFNDDKRNERTHSLYDQSVELADELAIHYLYGCEPGEKISERRPSEPETLLEYREKTYEQKTFSVANKIVGVQRGFLFNKDTYRVEIPEDPPSLIPEKFAFEDYLKDVPGIGNFYEYCEEFVLQFVNIDANGYFAIIPDNYEQQEEREIVNPIPVYIPSDNILWPAYNYVFIKSDEENEEGVLTYYLFTRKHTIKFFPKERNRDGEIVFEPIVVHEHNWGTPMIRQIRGFVSTDRKTGVLTGFSQVLQLPHVTPTLPHLNSILAAESDIQAAIVNHLYPPKYEGAVDCPTCKGTGGVYDEQGDSVECHTCNGMKKVGPSKLLSGSGPFLGYLVEPDEQGKYPIPAGYITNSDVVNAIKEAREIIKEEERKAYAAVNMEFIFDSTARTRTEKEVKDDSKLFEAFLRQTSSTVFSLCNWMLRAMNHSRYSVQLGEDQIKENQVVMHEPKVFDTSSVEVLLERIQKSLDAKVPKASVNELVKLVVPKMFGNNSDEGKKALAILEIDPFPLMDEDDILGMQSAGVEMDENDLFIKANATSLVEEAMQKNKDFLSLNTTSKKEYILSLIDDTERAPE